MSQDARLLWLALVAVTGLILLIARCRLPAFVALILASLFVGAAAGMPLIEVPRVFLEGVGAVLGSITIIIALGTVIGKLLAESGGAQVVAATLAGVFGAPRLHWAVVVIAFVIGFPVWFTVGLVLLVPIVFTLAKETRTPLLFLGVPLLAGLAVAHGFVPPHPGPMAAVELLGADLGKTIVWSGLIGLPTALLVGVSLARWISDRVPAEAGPLAAPVTAKAPPQQTPAFGATLLTILLPIALMLAATLADLLWSKGQPARAALNFAGHPMVAMLAGALAAFYTFGYARGLAPRQMLRFSEECLAPVALVLLVVGCGGGLSRVLTTAGVGRALSALAEGAQLSPLVLGWLLAALLRVATGSATVSITTAAGLMADYAAQTPDTNRELLVVAMGAGSSICSHVNDGGFWFVKEYFNLTVPQTFQSWTVMISAVSVVGLLLVLLCNALL